MKIDTTPEIESAIDSGAPVAIGISGGKDSGALAIALSRYLKDRGLPKSKMILIHADLGSIEWEQTAEWVQKLADFLGLELVIVRRKAGGMIERWESRWEANKARYVALQCVTLIPPWSTPALRFCTSELKVDPITSALKKRFPMEPIIINATGIRAQESKSRAEQPISKIQIKLKRRAGMGYDWHPIHSWTLENVLDIQEEIGFPLHPAYTQFGSTRLSCSFCILASGHDHKAAASFNGNESSYIRLVALEVASAFSFQSKKWLGDLRPELLSDDLLQGVAQAKVRERIRAQAEKRIPRDLLFTKGWPHRVPTPVEAELLAEIRQTVLGTATLASPYTTAASIIDRYADLVALKAIKDAKLLKKAA